MNMIRPAVMVLITFLFCFSCALAQSSSPAFKEKKIVEKSGNYNIEISCPLMTESIHPAGCEKYNALIHQYFDAQIKVFQSDYERGESAGVTDIPWSLNYSYVIKYNSPSLVSILLIGSDYCGGAHPTPVYHCVNFDLEKGKVVVMKDIFHKGSGYYEKLSTFCIRELKKRDISSNNELINEGASSRAENFECFYFKRDAMVILFPPYQVAPYEAGPQEVMIPYRAIRDLIDRKSPAGQFIRKGE